MSGDPRTTLARADLAEERLEGLVRAERYARAQPMRCRSPAAAIRRSAGDDAQLDDQLLFGETFEVLEQASGWAWGQARRDGYVGYVRLDALQPGEALPTHWVSALRTFGFAEPSVKASARGPFSINALIRAGEERNGFVDGGEAGWLFKGHLKPFGDFESDPAAIAERFLGAPYLWGGRDSLGLDCSGLVQQGFYACGRACPRDADQQQAAFPSEVARGALQRGDLVFWPDHVGLLIDATRVLHANGHSMAVSIEPLDEAVRRIAAAGGGEPQFRRP